VWSSQIDQNSGKIYYHNRLSGKSEWKKPKNFDGYDLKEQRDNEYTRTFKVYTATPLEEPKHVGIVQVGQWEDVAPEEDYFKVNAAKDSDDEQPATKAKTRRLPEGEIVGELHSDIDKYDNPDHTGTGSSMKKRDIKADSKQEVDKDDKSMLSTKDQLALLRKKVDRGVVDENYRKVEFAGNPSLTKSLGKSSKLFKKKKKRDPTKKRKIVAEGDDY